MGGAGGAGGSGGRLGGAGGVGGLGGRLGGEGGGDGASKQTAPTFQYGQMPKLSLSLWKSRPRSHSASFVLRV